MLRVGSATVRRDAPVLGSHGLGVADAVELARSLDRLPKRLTIVGVEARVIDVGDPMSEQVRDSVEHAVQAVVDALPGLRTLSTNHMTRRPGSSDRSLATEG